MGPFSNHDLGERGACSNGASNIASNERRGTQSDGLGRRYGPVRIHAGQTGYSRMYKPALDRRGGPASTFKTVEAGVPAWRVRFPSASAWMPVGGRSVAVPAADRRLHLVSYTKLWDVVLSNSEHVRRRDVLSALIPAMICCPGSRGEGLSALTVTRGWAAPDTPLPACRRR